MSEKFSVKWLKELYKINEEVILSGKSECWPMYGSGIESYEDSFLWTGESPISEFLYERKKQNIKSYAVDLASDTTALRNLSERVLINGGVAVGLSDLRGEGERALDKFLNVEMVKGDLLKRSTWLKIARYMKGIGSSTGRADLIVCRPGAGLLEIPTNYSNVLIRRMVNFLNPCGQLITQTHAYQSEEAIKSSVEAGLGNKRINKYFFLYRRGLYLKLADR